MAIQSIEMSKVKMLKRSRIGQEQQQQEPGVRKTISKQIELFPDRFLFRSRLPGCLLSSARSLESRVSSPCIWEALTSLGL